MPLTPESEVREIWVNVTEAAEITGYFRDHLRKLATRIWKQPEEKREIRLRKRSSGYEIWLPDLLDYIQKPAHGPQPNKKKIPT
jgi:hypothetical protein